MRMENSCVYGFAWIFDHATTASTLLSWTVVSPFVPLWRDLFWLQTSAVRTGSLSETLEAKTSGRLPETIAWCGRFVGRTNGRVSTHGLPCRTRRLSADAKPETVMGPKKRCSFDTKIVLLGLLWLLQLLLTPATPQRSTSLNRDLRSAAQRWKRHRESRGATVVNMEEEGDVLRRFVWKKVGLPEISSWVCSKVRPLFDCYLHLSGNSMVSRRFFQTIWLTTAMWLAQLGNNNEDTCQKLRKLFILKSIKCNEVQDFNRLKHPTEAAHATHFLWECV